jgi:hypothetical protein
VSSPPKLETTATTTGLSYVGCNADLGQGIYMNNPAKKLNVYAQAFALLQIWCCKIPWWPSRFITMMLNILYIFS